MKTGPSKFQNVESSYAYYPEIYTLTKLVFAYDDIY